MSCYTSVTLIGKVVLCRSALCLSAQVNKAFVFTEVLLFANKSIDLLLVSKKNWGVVSSQRLSKARQSLF
jgi:hypothetical protein